ncbi:MAG: Gfo/Idh/MocA family oxidoreductase [Lentisphaerae bacterium]|nr:Gfo/Idh/MocA family oxidoreductase [Lentisphaerota bacterium]
MSNSAENNRSPVRGLVVGMGFMGAVHCKNMLESPRWELAGVVEPRGKAVLENLQNSGNQGNLDLPMEALAATPFFPTLADAVQTTGAEAVVLAVPLTLHEDLALEALRLDLNVLLEKPFALDHAGAQRVIAAARKAQKKLMIAHCVRFSPIWHYLADTYKQNTLGKLRCLYIRRAAGFPNWGVWRDPAVRQNCGGALMDLLIHDLDFVRSLGRIESYQLEWQHNEYREISLKLADSVAAIRIHGGWLEANVPFSSEYVAEFEQGTLVFHSMAPGKVQCCSENGVEVKEFTGSGYAIELDYFAECIQNNCPPELCLPEESAEIVDICRKIQQNYSV